MCTLKPFFEDKPCMPIIDQDKVILETVIVDFGRQVTDRMADILYTFWSSADNVLYDVCKIWIMKLGIVWCQRSTRDIRN